MTRLKRVETHRTLIVLLIGVFLPFIAQAGTIRLDATAAEKIHLLSGKSIIIKSDIPLKRVSIGNPEVADFTMLSPTQIYITGKTAGTTNLTLWKNGQVDSVYDLEVAYDLSRLKEQLHNVLPSETELQVLSTGDTITLAGRISNAGNLARALALARAYAPKDKVTNLIDVGGVHQVMLEVRVAEMARSTTKRLGINFAATNGDEFGFGLLGKLVEIVNPSEGNLFTHPALGTLVTPSVNALFRFNSGSTTWTGFIDALHQDGLAKVLAEPTLVAQSGQKANFLAGGEFPVPIPQGLGTVAISYKPFGVGLTFEPTVLGKDKISIKVTPEVSELDFSTAVQFSGFVIPGLTTRRASTTIELGDGQSFSIAGLLRENILETIQKFPVLGDIPILGALFRSESFKKQETELVIIVTPRLVKPLNTKKQTLPTDFFIEPDDFEFYLKGRTVGRNKAAPPAVFGDFDGEFGHSTPEAE